MYVFIDIYSRESILEINIYNLMSYEIKKSTKLEK